MKIQYFNGGLANQVFQYIFYRYAQLESPKPNEWFLDDSFFYFRNEHNGYELERVFGLHPNLLSQQFEPAAWELFIENRKNKIGTADTLSALGFQVSMIAEAQNYKNDNPFHGSVYTIPCNEYHPEVLDFKDDIVYYFGYWINKKWFAKYKDIFRRELSFPPISDEKNITYATQIKSTLSVGIHIRRGDYVSHGWNMDADYYLDSAQKVLNSYPDSVFFVFSDDPDWCEVNASALGIDLAKKAVFIRGNIAGNNYIDMQLLSMCKGMIMSNSAFCYLAALLDTSLQFCMNPTPWREV